MRVGRRSTGASRRSSRRAFLSAMRSTAWATRCSTPRAWRSRRARRSPTGSPGRRRSRGSSPSSARGGRKAGGLPEVFRTLEGIFEGRARLKRQLALDLSYPLLLLHLAFLLPRLSVLVATGVSAYLRVAFGPILILWAVVAGIAIAIKLARQT